MNVLFVASDNIPHIGGKSTHIIELSKALSEDGINCDIISQSSISKSKLLLIKTILQPLKLIDKELYILYFKNISGYLLKKITEESIRNKKIDVVSAQDAWAVTAIGEICNKNDIPIVLTMHTYFGIENGLDKRLSKIGDKMYKITLAKEVASLKYCFKVIAVDDRIRTHVQETLVSAKLTNNIEVVSIPNFTDPTIFKPADKEIKGLIKTSLGVSEDFTIICCARRLVEKNGVIYLLKAISQSSFLKNKVICLIAGDGPELHNISDFVKSEKLENVKILGSQNSTEMLSIYQISDISVVPSITINGLQEATSITALESMSCQLITVASEIGGLRQMILNGIDGFLFPEKNYIELSKILEEIVANIESYRSVGDTARLKVYQLYSNTIASRKYTHVFSSAIRESNNEN